MKVALVPQPQDMIFPPMQNSIGVWAYEVAQRLARSCEVIVYSGRMQNEVEFDQGVQYRRASPIYDHWLRRLLDRFSRFRKAKRPFFASGLNYLGHALQVARDLRAQRCDIVHIHNLSQFMPIIRAFNPDIKIVLHMHCEWLTQLDRAMIEPRLRVADLIIGCSEYITAAIRRGFPQFAGRCRTVHNGVDLNEFADRNGRDKTGGSDARRILFAGRVSPEKGVHVLLEAFQNVAERQPGAQLNVVGPIGAAPVEFIVALSNDAMVHDLSSFYRGDYFSHLQDQLPSNLAQHVSFTGSVPHTKVMDHFRQAEVFVHPSVWGEPFPLAVLEAMAAGLPVVATRIGGLPESIKDGETGLLVEPNDAATLADAIVRLLSDPELRKSMGKAARRRAVELFSWERVATDLLHQYEQLWGNFA
jgi:glycosyltransferase involved in cell wall biosynthesis